MKRKVRICHPLLQHSQTKDKVFWGKSAENMVSVARNSAQSSLNFPRKLRVRVDADTNIEILTDKTDPNEGQGDSHTVPSAKGYKGYTDTREPNILLILLHYSYRHSKFFDHFEEKNKKLGKRKDEENRITATSFCTHLSGGRRPHHVMSRSFHAVRRTSFVQHEFTPSSASIAIRQMAIISANIKIISNSPKS